MHDLAGHVIERFGYLAIYGLLVIANLGIPTGSEFIVAFAGALVALHRLPGTAWTVAAVAMAGEISGASVLYWIARSGGRRMAERYGHAVGISQHALERGEAFFRRWGPFAVFFARFVPFVRGIDAIPAGALRMPVARYYAATIAGSLIFCVGLAYLGGTLAARIGGIGDAVSRISNGAALVPIAVLVVALGARMIRSRRDRSAAGMANR